MDLNQKRRRKSSIEENEWTMNEQEQDSGDNIWKNRKNIKKTNILISPDLKFDEVLYMCKVIKKYSGFGSSGSS